MNEGETKKHKNKDPDHLGSKEGKKTRKETIGQHLRCSLGVPSRSTRMCSAIYREVEIKRKEEGE